MRTLLFLLLVQLFSNAIIAQSIIDSGLVAYYPFNSNALDESGNGNDATVYNAILTSDRFGILNSAYSFNGTGSYIESLNTTLPTSSESRTISFWLKSTQDTIASIFNIGQIESADTSTIFNIQYKNGSIEIYTLLGVMEGWATNNGEWHHIAITYEDSSFAILYQDGYQNVMIAGPGNYFSTVGSTMRIGAPLSSIQEQSFFSGILDDIRIYNRALSASEIDSLYKENQPTQVSELSEISMKSFILYQNYPNPFNPTTTISFFMHTSAHIYLRIYDELGNIVANPINKFVAAGIYKFEFNATDLSSGVYYYQIQTDNYIQTKKMLLLK